VKDFKNNKELLNKELERFTSILVEVLPHYSTLLKKENLSNPELTELGEIEHFLIEVNGKITAIKNLLEQDLFGHSLDIYYKLKFKANLGDSSAKAKLDRLRATFEDSFTSGSMINWN
jgi:hypothetical protein